jgi:hypothetical protein
LEPGAVFQRFSLHLPIEVHYRNPGADVALGGRATFIFWRAFGGFVPLRLLAQGAYLVRGQGAAVGGGAMVGLGALLHLAALYDYDTDRNVHSLGIRIGFDLLSVPDPVAAITHFVPQAPPPELELP